MGHPDLSVLILAQYFPPDLGGSTTRAYNVAKGLALNGCKVTVVTAFPHYPHGKIPKVYRRRFIRIEWLGRIKIIRTFILPMESKGLWRRIFLFASFAMSSLFALPLAGKTDVIWAANPDIAIMIPAIIYGKIKRRPVAANMDDLAIEDAYDLKVLEKGSMISRLIEHIARLVYSKAKAITPISPSYPDLLSRLYGVEKTRIHLVRGGVDTTIFKPKASQGNGTKKGFMVLYSGAFSIAYDFGQVLKAAGIIENKDRSVEFIIQGKGELASQIREDVRKLGLKNVKVIDDLLSRIEVARFLSQADVLIQPLGDFGRPHLGISTKLFEYQAVGKPIVCTSNATPGQYISETKSGIIVKPGDCRALAEAILYLKRNPTAAQRMGRNGREFVKANASIEAIGSQMRTILGELKR